MEKLKNAVDGLIAALAGTETYRDYMRAKERIAPSQMEQIDSYKRLRGSLMSDYSAENAARVREMGRNLMLDKTMRNYILCERKMLNMVTGVYDSIGDGLKIAEKQ